MCVLCVAICPCAYDESRAVRGVWAYNRVERGRARMLQLDMLLNLLFYSWSVSCYFYYYSALRADDGAAAFL